MARHRVLFLVTAYLGSAALVLAQTSTSQITGTVRDASGGVIPGAAVTAINEATGITYRQNTTEAGLYAFPSMKPFIETLRTRAMVAPNSLQLKISAGHL